jgi:hypothetical protein
VEPEFISGNFGEQSRAGQTFINRLVGFLSSNNLSSAILAGVFKHDMLDSFEDRADKLNLVGDIETDYFSGLFTARAGKASLIKTMFGLASLKRRGRARATAAVFSIGDDIQSSFLSIKLTVSLGVNGFACASQKSRVDFGGLLTEGGAVASAQLFFKFGNASE